MVDGLYMCDILGWLTYIYKLGSTFWMGQIPWLFFVFINLRSFPNTLSCKYANFMSN